MKEQPEKKTAKKPKPVGVKVVRREGPAALVEWVENGKLARKVVPVESLAPGPAVDRGTLDEGLEHGEDWMAVSGVDETLHEELHRIGIWTKEDLLCLSHRVREAVTKARVAPLVAALIEFAKED